MLTDGDGRTTTEKCASLSYKTSTAAGLDELKSIPETQYKNSAVCIEYILKMNLKFHAYMIYNLGAWLR